MNHKINSTNFLTKYSNTPKNRAFFILVDTNFIYFSLKNKINIHEALIAALSSRCIVCVSECVILELEKLGPKFRLALKFLREKKIVKITCVHNSSIIYADDCIFHTIKNFSYFFVATCDKDLKRRIRKISSTPIISIKKKKLEISRK